MLGKHDLAVGTLSHDLDQLVLVLKVHHHNNIKIITPF